VGRYLPQPVSVLTPPTTLSPLLPIGSGYIQAKLFPENVPIFSNLVVLHTYSPMKME